MRARALMQSLIKPLHDETLSSWLSRNATNAYVAQMHSDFLNNCRGMAKLGEGGDVDSLYEHKAFMSLFPERNHQALAATFILQAPTVNHSRSLNYCPQCLADDIASMHAPAWRRAWRARGNCFCVAHEDMVLLQRLPVASKDQMGRAWLAFSQHAVTGNFIFGNHFIQRLTSLSDTGSVEQRLCRIVWRVMRWVNSAAERPTDARPSIYCLEFLLGFFLYRPFYRCKGGVGQWFWSAGRAAMETSMLPFRSPTMAELTAGVEISLPRDVALSYLFIGCAYGLLSSQDVQFISRVLYFTNSPFPKDAGELRTLAVCFQPYHLLEFRRLASRRLYAGDVKHLHWLFG